MPKEDKKESLIVSGNYRGLYYVATPYVTNFVSPNAAASTQYVHLTYSITIFYEANTRQLTRPDALVAKGRKDVHTVAHLAIDRLVQELDLPLT